MATGGDREPDRGLSLNQRRIRASRLEAAQSALVLLERDGWEAIGVAELAAAAGLSTRTFHRYFPSKRDVFRPLLEAARIASCAQFEAAEGLPLPRRCGEAVITGVDVFRGGLLGGHRAYRLLLTTTELSPVWLDEALHFERALVDLVPTDVFARRQGSLKGERVNEARLAAAVLFAAMRVAMQTWAEGEDPRALRSLIERAVERVAGTQT
ncbi:helix-turn-helix domain-containing protein [Streptosporangium sp. NPDC001681]|uniref:TetR/AcrR family transcriptional regulator n=1 Tax=Streptosporangium sp. NPDC001681 TaxID=3154395 RepID=UPI00331F2A63